MSDFLYHKSKFSHILFDSLTSAPKHDIVDLNTLALGLGQGICRPTDRGMEKILYEETSKELRQLVPIAPWMWISKTSDD